MIKESKIPAYTKAMSSLENNPMLSLLKNRFRLLPEHDDLGKKGWACVNTNGYIRFSAKADNFGTKEEWEWVFAVLMVEVALLNEISKNDLMDPCTATALSVEARRLVKIAKVGRCPEILDADLSFFPNKSTYELSTWLKAQKIYPKLPSIAGENVPEITVAKAESYVWSTSQVDFGGLLAKGIVKAATGAVAKVSGVDSQNISEANKAKKWIIDTFPLLAAAASVFEIIDNVEVCERLSIGIAAVNSSMGEIYINPKAGLNQNEMRFVIAHEILHVVLDTNGRRKFRDHLLWNYATDFVINEWVEMLNIGKPPAFGLLRDHRFDNMAAEDVYDILIQEVRKNKKLICLSGKQGVSDILEGNESSDLASAARRGVLSAYDRMSEANRGLLPAALREEIKVLIHPPAPWDVELATWLTTLFPNLEPEKSYGRPSRRQSSCPDIPRPGRFLREENRAARVMATVIDTSASMDRKLLGAALGALASTALALGVDSIRLLWCDAAPVDEGWIEPDMLTGKISVKGRGGTVLQPAFDYLRGLALKDHLPEKCPILIITDGWCENALDTKGFECAALIPEGGPKPIGVKKVFRLS